MTYLQARQIQAGMTVRGQFSRSGDHVRFYVLAVLVNGRIFPSVHDAMNVLGYASAQDLGDSRDAELLVVDLIAKPNRVRRSFELHEGRWYRGDRPLTLILEPDHSLTLEALTEASKIWAKEVLGDDLELQLGSRQAELKEATAALQAVQGRVREAEQRLHLLQSEHQALAQSIRAAQELSTVLLRKIEGSSD